MKTVFSRIFIFFMAIGLNTGCQTLSSDELINMGAEVANQVLNGSLQGENALAVQQMMTLSGDRASNQLANMGSWSQVLPTNLQKYLPVLKMIDSKGYLNNVETSMQQAASAAAKEAGPIFSQAVKQMSIVDAVSILRGGQTSATDFFMTKTQDQLKSKFNTIIQDNLKNTGFYSSYTQLQSMYSKIPGADKSDLDLEGALSDQVLKTMYAQMGEQEKLIRQDPIGRGNSLIQRALSAAQSSSN